VRPDAAGSETFDHTADLGLRVWAPTLRGLFEEAGRGLIGMLFDAESVRPEAEMPVEAAGGEPEEMLVDWLTEVLLAFELERFVPADLVVSGFGADAISGRLVGETFDPARHEPRCVIKAVTYHDLEIVRAGDAFEVSIVFDV
jgi:SHS2 domain-containing protein